MPPSENLKPKLLTPEKLKSKLLTHSGMQTDTDRGNTICPFHHSWNGGGIKTQIADFSTYKTRGGVFDDNFQTKKDG